MDERFLDENILERYVEYVESTFLVDIVNSIEGNAPRNPTNDYLIKEHHEYAACWDLMNQIDDNNSPFLIEKKGVFSRCSRLDGAVRHVISALL